MALRIWRTLEASSPSPANRRTCTVECNECKADLEFEAQKRQVMVVKGGSGQAEGGSRASQEKGSFSEKEGCEEEATRGGKEEGETRGLRKHQKAQTICNWSAVILSAGHVSCWSTATCSARLCRLCDLCVRRLYNCVRVCAIRSVLMCLPGHTQPHTCTGMLGTSSGCISSRGSQLYCNAACKSAEGWRSTITILYALWKHRCHSLGALVKAVPKDIGGGCSHELLKNVRGLRDVV